MQIIDVNIGKLNYTNSSNDTFEHLVDEGVDMSGFESFRLQMIRDTFHDHQSNKSNN